MRGSNKLQALTSSILIIGLFLNAWTANAELCDAECANLDPKASEELKAECLAYKETKQAIISESVLLGIDGVTLASCALACSQIAIPVVGVVSGAACDAMGLVGNATEIVLQLVQSKGQFQPEMAESLIGIGISAHGLRNSLKSNSDKNDDDVKP